MKTKIAVIAIIEREGKLLFGLKPKDVGPYPNTLHLIGGKLNFKKESLIDGISREVLEESGIRSKVGELLAVGSDIYRGGEEPIHYLYFYFRVDIGKANPKPKSDLKKFIWVKISNLKKSKLNKPTIIVLRKIGYL